MTEGVEMEADICHADFLIAEASWTNSRAKGVSTPGCWSSFKKDFEDQRPLGDDATAKKIFRGSTAQSIYIAMDRPEVAHSGKEAARDMGKPSSFGVAKVKRLARFFKDNPRGI